MLRLNLDLRCHSVKVNLVESPFCSGSTWQPRIVEEKFGREMRTGLQMQNSDGRKIGWLIFANYVETPGCKQ